MSSLLWPGDQRAGDLMSDAAVMRAMVAVEAAWLAALADLKVADATTGAAAAALELGGLVSDDDVAGIAALAEAGGNPVIPLVSLLRSRVAEQSPAAAEWVHRGLTSQDVLDTALQLALRDVAERVAVELAGHVVSLAGLAERHRGTMLAGRTLTQHAVPITFGLKVSTWLHGVLDASDEVDGAVTGLAGQFGGAAGTLAAAALLATEAGHADGARVALDLAAQATATLGLAGRSPWHTTRTPVTRFGAALVQCSDAWGHIAGDVLTMARPEIAEVAEPAVAGRGGSSAMPQKANPVLSVLIRRAALAAPGLGAQLHVAAAGTHDERPDGAWHTEWVALQALSRRTVVAAAQASELLSGLQVDVDRMRANAESAAEDLLAEGRSLRSADSARSLDQPSDYLGATDLLVDVALDRARRRLGAGS
jgi:3-carboxy-cis,cis-muconate cycloisomerase